MKTEKITNAHTNLRALLHRVGTDLIIGSDAEPKLPDGYTQENTTVEIVIPEIKDSTLGLYANDDELLIVRTSVETGCKWTRRISDWYQGKPYTFRAYHKEEDDYDNDNDLRVGVHPGMPREVALEVKNAIDADKLYTARAQVLADNIAKDKLWALNQAGKITIAE